MEHDLQYVASRLDERRLRPKASFDSMYRCTRCPRFEVRNAIGQVVFLYDPYDRPTCERP